MHRLSWMIVLVLVACTRAGQGLPELEGRDTATDVPVSADEPAALDVPEDGGLDEARQRDRGGETGDEGSLADPGGEDDALREDAGGDAVDDPGSPGDPGPHRDLVVVEVPKETGAPDDGSEPEDRVEPLDRGSEDRGGDDTGESDPGAEDPGPGDAGHEDPGGTDPGVVDPGTVDPGTVDPGTVDPGTADPGHPDPGAEDPGQEDTVPVDNGAPDPALSDPGRDDPGIPDPGTPDVTDPCGSTIPGVFRSPAWAGGPTPNAWSWDSGWRPAAGAFPVAGLMDDVYFDGHIDGGRPTPILPPGKWDWSPTEHDAANWRNFYTNLGEFTRLSDGCDRQYGWKFVAKYPDAVDFAGPAEYLEGSAGTDVLLLGENGSIHSIAGSLAGGPDVLVFGESYSLDYRTGASSDENAVHDDDLVIAGCLADAGTDYPIMTTSIHTGPGADVVFARNLRASAIDAGNGAGGRTDTLDPADGDDFVLLGGNVKDVRFFGGRGSDTLVWYLDEMNEATPYQGGDFFGGGGAGDAVWGDPGIDRLVLAVPDGTTIVERPSDPPVRGAVLVMRENGGVDEPWWDPPTINDPFAKYCITCGRGPAGQRTLFVQYASADGSVNTGYVSVTAFEELQVGIEAGAKVYRLDEVTGRAILAADLSPIAPPPFPLEWCRMR